MGAHHVFFHKFHKKLLLKKGLLRRSTMPATKIEQLEKASITGGQVVEWCFAGPPRGEERGETPVQERLRWAIADRVGNGYS